MTRHASTRIRACDLALDLHLCRDLSRYLDGDFAPDDDVDVDVTASALDLARVLAANFDRDRDRDLASAIADASDLARDLHPSLAGASAASPSVRIPASLSASGQVMDSD